MMRLRAKVFGMAGLVLAVGAGVVQIGYKEKLK